MSEPVVPAPVAEPGQAPQVDSSAATPAAPATQDGQAPATTEPKVEDTFFDPSTVDPNLQPAYKSMQASYTKKMQALAAQRQELAQLADLQQRYARDPFATLSDLARQAGYTVAPMGQPAQAQQVEENWEPKTWDELLDKAKAVATQDVMSKLSPQLQQLQQMQVQSVEKTLDDIDPQWRDWEEAMTDNLKLAPHLAQNIPLLYEISMPKDVREARATQKALAKMRAQQAASSVEGKTTKTQTQPAQTKAKNFDEAVAIAKAQLAGR